MQQTMRLLKEDEFDAIEVSDGIHPFMTRKQKIDILEQYVYLGAYALCELDR